MGESYFCTEERRDTEGRVWVCLAPAGRAHVWDQVAGPEMGDMGGMST